SAPPTAKTVTPSVCAYRVMYGARRPIISSVSIGPLSAVHQRSWRTIRIFGVRSMEVMVSYTASRAHLVHPRLHRVWSVANRYTANECPQYLSREFTDIPVG